MSPDRERGFIVIQRQIQSSALWLSLRGDQRMVMFSILLMANWTPGRARWKGQWYEVGRGELSYTMGAIARHAKTTIAVVRSTIEALLADDGHLGGNGPFLTQRYPITNTGPHTGPRVLTVVNYNKHQDIKDEANTGPNADLTQGLAQTSHRPRTDLAQIEPSKPIQPLETQKLAPRSETSTPSAVVVVVPCVGSGPHEYGITDAQIDHWKGLYPGLDVLGQVRQAAAWSEANPRRRKTHGGVPSFIVRWLNKAQDGGRAGQPQLPPQNQKAMAAVGNDWEAKPW